MSEYHIPVMLPECLEGLRIDPDGVYVDVTYGSGAHSRAILDQLGDQGRLYSLDQDGDVVSHVDSDPRLSFIQGNFRYLRKLLRLEGVTVIDGLLADLGVSSHQLDFPERGFSFRFDAELDMRMSEYGELTARTVLATYTAEHLQGVLSKYGEVRNAKTLAQRIVEARGQAPIVSTSDLNDLLAGLWMGSRNRYFAQVYQAIRMEVNAEMDVLADMLDDATRVLKPGGRLVVMSYHSLEDRMVKNVMKSGSTDGDLDKDEYGHIHRPYKLITKKPIEASTAEVDANPRARSAKLRIAQKV